MADQYRLQSNVTRATLDASDRGLGTFDIEDGYVTVDDYETAQQLVNAYSLYWEDNRDPGHPDADPIVTGDTDVGGFDVSQWLDERTVSKVREDLEDIDDVDVLRALRDESDRTTATDAIDNRLETVEASEEEAASAETDTDEDTITTEDGSTGDADSQSAHGILNESNSESDSATNDAEDSDSNTDEESEE
jgi:hypothetical protein